jgi:hypothetical protein
MLNNATAVYRLGGSSSDDNGIITIEREIKGLSEFNQFRLAGVSTVCFNIFYRDKSTVYNISVKF